MPTDPVLVVHRGACAMPDDMVEAHIRGVRNALAAGWRVLEIIPETGLSNLGTKQRKIRPVEIR